MKRRALLVVLAALVLLASLTLGIAIPTTGAAEAEPCPNEAIRTEQHSTYLDDCRAYEMVSPAQKNAADVLANPSRTRAALDGGAVQYTSLTGFGDVHGGSRATEYLTRRTTDGAWRTHAINPAQEPDSLIPDATVFDARFMGDFSSDLSHGVFMAKTPLTDAPNVDNAVNLYLRSDLLSPGAGTYQLLTDATGDQGDTYDPSVQPAVAGASADFSHVLFESTRSLLPDAAGLDPEAPKLYEWVNGATRFIGMVPGTPQEQCGGSGPPCVPSASQAGQGALLKAYTATTISADGRRIVFTVRADTAQGGQLYLRDDQGTATLVDDTTVHVNASERTIPATPQDARFWTASADATKVFFTSAEKLTDEDPNDSRDLYRYDQSAPAGDRLARVSVDSEPADNGDNDLANGHEVLGAIGASANGDTVYFLLADLAGSQLVLGGPTARPLGNAGAPGGARIYRWHLGDLNEVGGVNTGGSAEAEQIVGRGGWNLTPKWSRVSPDGRHLVFISQGTDQLLSHYGKPEYDHGDTCRGQVSGQPACLEVYVYDAAANEGQGDLLCASCNPTGAPATGDAEFFAHFATGVTLDTSHLSHALSDDGRFVFFDSDEDLLEEDTNATTDAYAYNTQTEQLSLLSSGTSNTKSIFLDASADGRDAFILTRSQLVGKDHDQSADLYDVRLNGGHPEPLTAAPCDPLAPDSCPASGGSSPTPAATPPTGAPGPGNRVQQRKRKRHRKRQRHGKPQRAAARHQGGSR